MHLLPPHYRKRKLQSHSRQRSDLDRLERSVVITSEEKRRMPFPLFLYSLLSVYCMEGASQNDERMTGNASGNPFLVEVNVQRPLPQWLPSLHVGKSARPNSPLENKI